MSFIVTHQFSTQKMASLMAHEQVQRGKERDPLGKCASRRDLFFCILVNFEQDSEAAGNGNFREIVNWKKSLNDKLCLKAVVFCFVFVFWKIRAFGKIIFLWFIYPPTPRHHVHTLSLALENNYNYMHKTERYHSFSFLLC